jgi:hypothetical protein
MKKRYGNGFDINNASHHINYSTLRGRINAGWDVEKAFSRPLGRWLNDSQQGSFLLVRLERF